MSPTTDWLEIRIGTRDRFTSQDRYIDCVIWCAEQFGKRWEAGINRDGRWCCFWCGPRDHEHFRFHFRDQLDAVLFALRWS